MTKGEGGYFSRVDVYLGPKPDRLVPELSGWRRERLPELPDEPGVTVAPDWVCEVLSPSTESTVRAGKMRVYCRERVDHVWLIDPQMRRLEVYRHGGAGWSRLETFAGGALVRAEPFDAIEFSLAQLWAW